MKTSARILALLLMSVLLLSLASCAPGGRGARDGAAVSSDREGNPIALPGKIERIISMGPSNTEILVALGFGEQIVAADTYSENIEGLPAGTPLYSMMTPDGEQLVALAPDIAFVTGMSLSDGGDPFQGVANAGVCVAYIPSSTSIEGIKADIAFLAETLGRKEKGDEIIADMEREIDAVRRIGETITERKTVYFEIAAAPNLYSFGTGTFLNEMLLLTGAENILGEREEWLAVTDEAVLAADPDVILTSVDYIDDPVGEIKARPGWGEIAAVKNDAVYAIDTDASNRPSHHIVKALWEMAKAVYPEQYGA